MKTCAGWVAGMLAAIALRGTPPVDPALPAYDPRPATVPADARYLTSDGAIVITGYNDMAGILEAMGQLFARTHPGVRFALDLRGTRTAPPALASGRSAFAPMGAEMTPDQLAAYRRVANALPLDFKVAHAALNPEARSGPIGIFVARGNPLDRMTVAEVARVFTARPDSIASWDQLGLRGAWAGRSIHVYGLAAGTALAIYMQRQAFGDGPVASGYIALPESADVVTRVGADLLGIGFAALNRGTPGVKALAIAAGPGAGYSQASLADLQAGRYPFDRFLHLYARQPVDPFVREYLRLVLSREGQEVIAAAPPGYIPLAAAEAAHERERLN